MDDGWEEQISQNLNQLQVRDEETGECWPADLRHIPSHNGVGYSKFKEIKPTSTRSIPCCSKLTNSLARWKVPKEYSHLGASSPGTLDSQCAGKQCPENKQDLEGATYLNFQVEEENKTNPDGGLLVTFPSSGKVPLFCRKRKVAGSPTSKEPTKKSGSETRCTVERFLEGRERLLFVGRLFFAFLLLLSPGFVCPILFFIRIMCHVQRHNTCGGQDEAASTLLAPRSLAFFLPRAIMKYSCRLCREDMNNDVMFRIHSKMGLPSGVTPMHREEVDTTPSTSTCDCCHNHH